MEPERFLAMVYKCRIRNESIFHDRSYCDQVVMSLNRPFRSLTNHYTGELTDGLALVSPALCTSCRMPYVLSPLP